MCWQFGRLNIILWTWQNSFQILFKLKSSMKCHFHCLLRKFKVRHIMKLSQPPLAAFYTHVIILKLQIMRYYIWSLNRTINRLMPKLSNGTGNLILMKIPPCSETIIVNTSLSVHMQSVSPFSQFCGAPCPTFAT